jgi:hypothetical protein
MVKDTLIKIANHDIKRNLYHSAAIIKKESFVFSAEDKLQNCLHIYSGRGGAVG